MQYKEELKMLNKIKALRVRLAIALVVCVCLMISLMVVTNHYVNLINEVHNLTEVK